MDAQYLLNVFFALFSAGAGWFAREMWAAVKELNADLSRLREDLPKEYVVKNDFRQGLREVKEDFKGGITEVKEMLGKIFDRLDNKVDK